MDTETCSPLTYDPGVIESSDGELLIDRSTDPANYDLHATSGWDSIRRCTLPDGTVETEPWFVAARWVWAVGKFDGDRLGAEVWGMRWNLQRAGVTRLPPRR